jgi:hypothetical protein
MEVLHMTYDPGYTKANVSYEANALLKELAKEKTESTGTRYHVKDIVDEILNKMYPEKFRFNKTV